MNWLRLHRRIHLLQAVNVRLRVKVDQLERTNRMLSRYLQQARRDALVLASMARDPEVAAGFIGTAHDIDRLDEPA